MKLSAWLKGACTALLLLLTGCAGGPIPSDPHGTLEQVTGGTLHVGVDESTPWVVLQPGREPQGIEPELVREFASAHDARVVWVDGSEHELVEELKHGELELVIAGFESDTPWSEHAGVTRPYLQTKDDGDTVKHVMLVPKGENRFLLELDQFLQSRDGIV